ncbi:MAG: SH3 domain-containing protein [Clostridia bacterium]|nr:SH3 domain-containing protein [Clostridia bacterium]
MKRLFFLLLMLLSLCFTAFAADSAEDAAIDAILAAHPDFTVMDSDQWGTTAAAVLEKGDERILCIAEYSQKGWELTIDNPQALPQGEKINIYTDTDTAVFWSYETNWYHYGYCTMKTNGVWGVPDCIQSDIDAGMPPQYTEYGHRYKDGILTFTAEIRDLNENLLSSHIIGRYPAAWVSVYDSLAVYDESIYPNAAKSDDRSNLNSDALKHCAAELVPQYTFIDGAATENGLEMLMQDEKGTLRLVTCAVINGEPIVNLSSPLPAGSHYGYENYCNSLWTPHGKVATPGVFADGAWHISYVFKDSSDAETIFMGRNWIAASSLHGEQLYVGDHPWKDLSIDWNKLPGTMEEALSQLDASRWAVVNNPNPADRLHLRERASKNSDSMGKFYNGTPLEVLQKGDTWTRVRTPSGFTGWMMTKYLAFGEDAWKVVHAFPQMLSVDDKTVFPVWKCETVLLDHKAPKNGDFSVYEGDRYYITGVYGDEWFHVWFPDLDEGGMMRQSDFWLGNG